MGRSGQQSHFGENRNQEVNVSKIRALPAEMMPCESAI